MFSLDNFYYVLHANFLQPFKISDLWYINFGSTEPSDLAVVHTSCSLDRDGEPFGIRMPNESGRLVYFYDQEPLLEHALNKNLTAHGMSYALLSNKKFKILANSEHSELKTTFCRTEKFYDWYYFFHGLLALEWYRDYKYIPKINRPFTKVFISLNHLVTKDRSYRLALIANLMDRDLLKHGNVSCSIEDVGGTWKSEIFDSESRLSKESKKLIYTHFKDLTGPMTIDVDNLHGKLSAKLNMPLQESALWHLVTETVFYHNKLHLTEKIFKPIVVRRPFILAAAPGNLAYLKSYGFKTFDRWIDESYDQEPDHDKRLNMIAVQIEKLCQQSPAELAQMYDEMQDVLDYNFDHFYGEFKSIVVKEMIDNYEACLRQYNVGLDCAPDRQIDITKFDRDAVYRRLMM